MNDRIDRLAKKTAELLARAQAMADRRLAPPTPSEIGDAAEMPTNNDPAAAPLQAINIGCCSRCGGDHRAVEFRPLAQPFAPPEAGGLAWTHWAPCPTNGEPMLLIADYAPGGDPTKATSALEHQLYAFVDEIRTIWIPRAVAAAIDGVLGGVVARTADGVQLAEVSTDELRACGIAAAQPYTADPKTAAENPVGWPVAGASPAHRALEEMTAERDRWKKRAAKHGCDIANGDDDCG